MSIYIPWRVKRYKLIANMMSLRAGLKAQNQGSYYEDFAVYTASRYMKNYATVKSLYLYSMGLRRRNEE